MQSDRTLAEDVLGRQPDTRGVGTVADRCPGAKHCPFTGQQFLLKLSGGDKQPCPEQGCPRNGKGYYQLMGEFATNR